MDVSSQHRRDVTGNHIGDGATINQGDVHYHLPHRPAAPVRCAVRVIPYPRNPDVVPRPDLVHKLETVLSSDHSNIHTAALWGLGGSGKTQIALEYAYRRFGRDAPNACSVFWVHADSEATFAHDYKTIAAKLRVDKSLEGEDLFAAVRDAIENEPSWVLVLDNAGDLALFGIGRSTDETKSLEDYVPQSKNGTVLWTSRDGRIAHLVGPRQAIKVAEMTATQATELLATARNDAIKDAETEDGLRLVEELLWLPLAISQAGAFMRRTSTPIREYLSMLRQSQQRWEVLGETEFDRHRRRGLSHSVLKSWSISVERIRAENKVAYRILHIIAFVDNKNIPFEMLAASSGCEDGRVVEVKQAVARLVEFSFLGLNRREDGEATYEMHKLVQEATRYGLGASKVQDGDARGNVPSKEQGPGSEAHFATMALELLAELFPKPSRETWEECEKYLAHALKVGGWVEVSGKKRKTAKLLSCVSDFLFERGRWREKEPVDIQALALRREIFGERHPHTLSSMANLAVTYHQQGRYGEAEEMKNKMLALRHDILGARHPDTLLSMANLAATYYHQGRYAEAEKIYIEVLALRREVLGAKHPHTLSSMANLAMTHHQQGRYDEAEKIYIEVLPIQHEALGEKHPHTIRSRANLGAMYHTQGRYDEAEKICVEVLAVQREVLGEKHPDTLSTMYHLALTRRALDASKEALQLMQHCHGLQHRVLGEAHHATIQSANRLKEWQ